MRSKFVVAVHMMLSLMKRMQTPMNKTTSTSSGHTLNSTILREYDIRGIVGDTVNADDYRAIGRAMGAIVADRVGGRGTVTVGYDGRLSSPELEAALVDGLLSSGHDVVRVGLGPTPMLYLATDMLEADAGLMVTGSHNPPNYNGLKSVVGGKPFYGEDIQKLGEVCRAGKFVNGAGKVTDKPFLENYVERIAQNFVCDPDLRVAWDPGNGAAGDATRLLTERISGHHVLINEEIDGTFPAHHPDPTVEENLVQLKELVAANDCDLGIAFDGDGDRIGVIDGRGRVLWGDQLMVFWARDVLQTTPGATIIADVKASQTLFDEIDRMGGNPMMWCTGHSLIKSKMSETGAPLAGEMSGHIFFADQYYGFDDALYAATRLLTIVGNADKSLAEMRDDLPSVVNTPELRFECDDIRKFEVIKEVKERLADLDGITVHDMDGVRVQSDDGWWLLRASNTQAVLVARCEAQDTAKLTGLMETLCSQLRLSGVEPPDFGV